MAGRPPAIQIVPVTASGIRSRRRLLNSQPRGTLYLMELEFDRCGPCVERREKVLTYGVDFVVAETTGKLNLVPLKPLNPFLLQR